MAMKSHGPSLVPCGTPLGVCDHSEKQSYASFTSSLVSIAQKIANPINNISIYIIIRQFSHQQFMINKIKSFSIIHYKHFYIVTSSIRRFGPVMKHANQCMYCWCTRDTAKLIRSQFFQNCWLNMFMHYEMFRYLRKCRCERYRS